jgi:predicted transcriptional regulator
VNRNITFSLPAALIKRAKILAAEQETSLNALARQAIEQAVEADKRYQEAGARLLRKSRAGLYEIKPGSWSREDLHERSGIL